MVKPFDEGILALLASELFPFLDWTSFVGYNNCIHVIRNYKFETVVKRRLFITELNKRKRYGSVVLSDFLVPTFEVSFSVLSIMVIEFQCDGARLVCLVLIRLTYLRQAQ